MTKTRKTLRKQKQQKKQKLWNMRGCSSRRNKKSMTGGGCGCGNPFFGGQQTQTGGGCGCGASFLGGSQTGGMKMGGSEPALIGTPWTANISTWPGVAGNAGQSNFFSLNNYTPFSPETQMGQERDGQIFPADYVKYLVRGGKRSVKSKSKKSQKRKMYKKILKGGTSIFGQDLLNTGRSIQYGLGSAYNTLLGYPAPVDPAPYSDQYTRNQYTNIKPPL